MTSKNTAVLHSFPCNKLFTIRLGIFECKSVKCTHFNRSSFLWNCRAENLKSFKLPYLRIILYPCFPVNNPEAFSIRTMIAWSSFEHKQIHFLQYVKVFFTATAKLFAEFSLSVNAVYLNSVARPHFAVKSSPYSSGLGCIIYCLAGENGE